MLEGTPRKRTAEGAFAPKGKTVRISLTPFSKREGEGTTEE
jgi:hypothetical protein